MINVEQIEIDEPLEPNVVESLIALPLTAVIEELDRYGAAVAGGNDELKGCIAASHRECVNAAISSAKRSYKNSGSIN